jgi:hypothetical protein
VNVVRRRFVAVVVLVVFGVVTAACSGARDTSDAASTIAVPADPIAVDVDGDVDGPDCFAGLCASAIPATLSIADAGSLLDELTNALQRTGDAPVSCHRVAHAVGRSAARGGATLTALLARYDGSCSGGYLHGVLQMYSATHGVAGVAGSASALCRNVPATGFRVVADCIHGFGHEFAVAAGADVAAGVVRCDALDAADRAECAGGALMQHYQDPAFDPTILDAAFCDTLPDGVYREVCHGQRWASALRAGTAPALYSHTCVGTYTTACGRGLGYLVAYSVDDTDTALQQCTSFDTRPGTGDTLATACTYGVVAAALENAGWDGDPARSVASVCPTAGPLAVRCQDVETLVRRAAGV